MNKYNNILKKYWGYSDFRPLQEDIIDSVAKGNDTLALMPTGGGKSITFQIPALASDGICIVVTPLIALMRDQVEDLKSKGIKAIAVHSGMTYAEIEIGLENCIYGNYKFLYLSPERLLTKIILVKLKEMNINLIAVDESHCISQWGYDFRPSYLNIASIREFIPDVPILALTATANSQVSQDIMEKLLFRKKNILKKSFERPNLIYLARENEDKLKYLKKIVSKISGSGIVYTRNRRRTKEISEFLSRLKIKSDYYHAGLGQDLRTKKEKDWKSGKMRIIVATNAFGMGIDKPDVRFVVHMDLPDSIESYFQEAGRCGRDGKTAYAVIVFNNGDITKLKKHVTTSFPEIDKVKRVYQALGNYYQIIVGSGKAQAFDFTINDFASKYGFSILTVYNSIKVLQKEGYIETTDELNIPSRIHFLVKRQSLYEFQVANADLDTLIKLILRSYSGLFTDYVRIDEDFLANKLKTSSEKIKEILLLLSKLKIISFIPRKRKPQILFVAERLDNRSLIISRKKYGERKAIYKSRVDSVINYVTQKNICRSRFLINYFDEKTKKKCGHCDICKESEEANLSSYESDLIQHAIKDRLKKHKALMDELVDELAFSEKKVLAVLQYLLDNEYVIMKKDQSLEWNKK
ncbi:ATP-dependent DNA helicase RecQ [Bacteroidota bacterium]